MSQKSQKTTVTRISFIRKFMQVGLTYDQAHRVYFCMVGILEESILNGHKVNFGRLGCLFPVRKPPRKVTMGFERGPDNSLTKTKRVFYLDARTGHCFKVYREFMRKHELS